MNTWLVEKLCCPGCGGRLAQVGEGLKCSACSRSFECHDDIPILVAQDPADRHTAEQVEYFEKEARARGEYSIEPWQRRYLERLRESYVPCDGDLVVDLGAGSGFMAIELAKLNCTCIACDITLTNLVQVSTVARRLGLAERVHVVCCDVQNLPIGSDIVDCVIANSILEHLPRDTRAASEINRVCRRRAGLMVSAPLAFKYIYPPFWPIHFVHDREMGHLRHYDDMSLARIFSDWEQSCVYYTGHFRKVAARLAELVGMSVDWERVEQTDRRLEDKRYGASTVICVFGRGTGA
jgi:ubiquinone/menaquinone biosynthesis C-methylase UbiE/uncharacterized protein YbaR (Trm112 family)